MYVKRRGYAWYLRKVVFVNGEKKRVDHPLGSFGDDAKAKTQAEAQAKKLWPELEAAYAAQRALEKAAPALVAAQKQHAERPACPSFAQYCATVYTPTYGPAKRQRTQAGDARMIACWGAVFGAMPMDQIGEAECLRALNLRRAAHTGQVRRKVQKKLEESTVQRERALMHAIFETAVANKTLTRNPWNAGRGKYNKMRKPGYKDPTRAHRILSEEDQRSLLAAVETTVRDARGCMVRTDARYARFLVFMVETGIRMDELLNASFKDLGDYVYVQGKFAKARYVVLSTLARQTLDEQWKDLGDVRSRRPKKRGPWWQNQQRFREVMRKLCKRAGILHLSPHDLRHTFGHRFLVNGGDLYTLSKHLGHSSIAVTERHYAYLREQDVAAKVLAVVDRSRTAPLRAPRRLHAVK